MLPITTDAKIDDGSCIYPPDSICGCTDASANNYNADANCDDGSCTYDRDQFIGSYSATENCSSGDYSYILLISESSQNTVTVVINNLSDFGPSLALNATISGSSITIPNQTVSFQGEFYTFNGQGTLNGTILSVSYTIMLGSNTDACSMTAIKL